MQAAARRTGIVTGGSGRVPDLIIRADATTAIGAGHLMRCLALAQEWRARGGRVEVLSCTESGPLQRRVWDTGARLTRLRGHHPEDPADLAQTTGALGSSKEKVLVLDNYHFDFEYQQSVRGLAQVLGVVDDINDRGPLCADVLVNQNIDAERFDYNVPDGCVQLLGTRYAMLRREFRALGQTDRDQPAVASRILVTMGGGDPDNVTLRVLQALASLQRTQPQQLEIRAVIGAVNPNIDSLRALTGGSEMRAELLVDAPDMPALMSWADLAIAGAGTTSWELAFMGVPSVLLVIAGNQTGIASGMAEANAAVSVERTEDQDPQSLARVIGDLLSDQGLRRTIAGGARRLVDGRGVVRVADALIAGRAES